mgnify:CR=1 FL=1
MVTVRTSGYSRCGDNCTKHQYRGCGQIDSCTSLLFNSKKRCGHKLHMDSAAKDSSQFWKSDDVMSSDCTSKGSFESSHASSLDSSFGHGCEDGERCEFGNLLGSFARACENNQTSKAFRSRYCRQVFWHDINFD